MKRLNLLIIEDHKIIARAYKNILNEIEDYEFCINFAQNCDEAVEQISSVENDIVILDLQLPTSENNKFLSGEDLGLLIRKKTPKTKIIILTSITNQIRVLNIVKEINPEGYMIKSDVDVKDFKDSIHSVLQSKYFYSKTIKKTTEVINYKGVTIDDFDRQILYHLSMGEKTKDLYKYIPLSTRAIEVRKTKLKTLLDINKDNNFNLVKAAKKLGFI
ncbi:response regulator [Hyunsoonleella pacifica]|uniref:Response regulator transcription factor n=1 Tax=Hyunsoonleella pacifica TaxID=1080224 RepID=A0A4Q9FMH9_9FLAO|nr:response regulator [Hyunsoonleella pacifica]TBN15538.1 response regulator transcription factor [Hyunsoonleella pacifica]GGD24849.1 hypothetical protein GCM10011368_28720 [Hyunsoonleella pacifica]